MAYSCAKYLPLYVTYALAMSDEYQSCPRFYNLNFGQA